MNRKLAFPAMINQIISGMAILYGAVTYIFTIQKYHRVNEDTSPGVLITMATQQKPMCVIEMYVAFLRFTPTMHSLNPGLKQLVTARQI